MQLIRVGSVVTVTFDLNPILVSVTKAWFFIFVRMGQDFWSVLVITSIYTFSFENCNLIFLSWILYIQFIAMQNWPKVMRSRNFKLFKESNPQREPRAGRIRWKPTYETMRSFNALRNLWKKLAKESRVQWIKRIKRVNSGKYCRRRPLRTVESKHYKKLVTERKS